MKKNLLSLFISIAFVHFSYAQSGTIIPNQADFLNSSTAASVYGVRGVIVSGSAGANSAGVRGQNNGTGTTGFGVYGSHAAGGYGVYGSTVRGRGVYGYSSGGGIGVYGQSDASYGVFGISTSSVAGRFENTKSDNTNHTLQVVTNGIGNAISVQQTNRGNGARGIDVNQAGVGPGVFSFSAGGNAVWGVTSNISSAGVIGDNTNGEAVVGRNRGAVGVGAVVGRNDSTGYGVRGFNTKGGIGVLGQAGISGGTGRGGVFENLNAANASNALEGRTNGSGAAAYFLNTSASGIGAGLVVQKIAPYNAEYTTSAHADLDVRHAIAGGYNGLVGLRILNTGGNLNAWTFYTNNSEGTLFLYSNGISRGAFSASTGAYTTASDIRLKNNIQTYASTLDNLMKVGVKSYKVTHSDKTEIGLIAQEVVQYFPEIVYNNKNDSGEQFYSMDYSRIGVLAVKAIQEQQLIIQKQQNAMQTQQNEINQLKSEMAELKSLVASLKK